MERSWEPSWGAIESFKLPYSELKRRTNIAPEVWSRYFTGFQSPTLRTMHHIADSLGLEFHDCIAAFEQQCEWKQEERRRKSEEESSDGNNQ